MRLLPVLAGHAELLAVDRHADLRHALAPRKTGLDLRDGAIEAGQTIAQRLIRFKARNRFQVKHLREVMAVFPHHRQFGFEGRADTIGLDMADGRRVEPVERRAEPAQRFGDGVRHACVSAPGSFREANRETLHAFV
jgi:hypothetical protein